jgi:hypothetical protein
MTDLNQDGINLAEQNNRRTSDPILDRFFPLEAGPRVGTFRDVVDQMRKANEASASLAKLIDGMHEAPRNGSPPA